MAKNINGGRKCRWQSAPGYNARGNGELLVSGITSVATPWFGFEYDPDSVVIPPEIKKFAAYHGPGIITQLPAIRLDYKAKNVSGGRKVPVSYIGAALRTPKTSWHKGLDGYLDDVRVRLASDVSQEMSLRPAA